MHIEGSSEGRRFRAAGIFMLAWVFWLLLVIAFEHALKDFRLGIAAAYLIAGALELVLLLPAAAYMRMKRLRLGELFGRARASQVAAGAFMGALLVPAVMPLTLFWNLFIRLTGGSLDASPDITAPQTALQFVAAFAAIGLSAPLVEEPVLRGLALNPAGGALGKTRAVLLVSALFTLMHGRFLGIPAIFTAGLLLAALAWRSGSLWPSVAAHASYNTLSLIISVLGAYIARRGPEARLESIPIPQFFAVGCIYILIALPFAAAIFVLLWAFRKYTPQAARPQAAPRGFTLARGWPWLVAFVLLAAYVALDVLRIYGIIGAAN
jgi:membrane protease YdiL (CAAX protease family)